jgi:hypothetical protein
MGTSTPDNQSGGFSAEKLLMLLTAVCFMPVFIKYAAYISIKNPDFGIQSRPDSSLCQ